MPIYGGITPISIPGEVVANPVAVTLAYTYGAIAISPDGTTAYVVAYGTGGSYVIPVALPSGVAEPPIFISEPGGDIGDIAISPDGSTLYITAPGVYPGIIVVLHLLLDAVSSFTVAGATSTESIVITPDGGTAYITDSGGGAIIAVDLATTIGTSLAVDGQALVISPDGSTLYVASANNVAVVDIATDTVTTTIDVYDGGVYITAIAITPDGSTAYVTPSTGGGAEAIDLGTNTIIGPVAGGFLPGGVTGLLCNDSTLFASTSGDAILPTADISTNTVGATVDMGSGAAVGPMALSLDGTTLYVICQARVFVSPLSPTNGPTTGATAVTVNGSGFYRVSSVTFGAVPAASFTIVTPETEILAVSPPGTGAVEVVVETPWGPSGPVGTNSDEFTYTAPPGAWTVGMIP